MQFHLSYPISLMLLQEINHPIEFFIETFEIYDIAPFITAPVGVHPGHIGVTPKEFSSNPKPCKEIIETPTPERGAPQ